MNAKFIEPAGKGLTLISPINANSAPEKLAEISDNSRQRPAEISLAASGEGVPREAPRSSAVGTNSPTATVSENFPAGFVSLFPAVPTSEVSADTGLPAAHNAGGPMTGIMHMVCSWCGHALPDKACEAGSTEGTGHGICPACAKIWHAKFEKEAA